MAFGNSLGGIKIVCVFIAAMSLFGCEDAPPTPISSSSPVAAPVGEVVAATINGQAIYVSDVQLEAEAQGLVSPGEPLATDSALFTRVLNSLIDDRLLAREAQAEGLHKDPFVQHRVDVLTNRLLGNALLNRAVDEQAIQKYYETAVNLQKLELGVEYRVREIVLPSRATAESLLKQMTSDTDFAVLASNRSIDERTRLEGGDLGWINPDDANSQYANAIRTTPIGGVSDPFETNLGWHVIKVEEKRDEPPPKLEELRPQIRDFLVASELERLLKKLHRDATIIRNFEEVEPAAEIDAFKDAEIIEDNPDEPADQTVDASPEGQESQ
ncbi:MAG: peptidylprolyl isomerase [Hirschia sp.]|nr:peptidylprolyl isomerase [Hirschia sp.]MBF17815.1 peptidylprolyl isomerase [Hirschia sp.]